MTTICKKCGKSTEHDNKTIRWDEHGYGYSTKICICKHCGMINIVKVVEDYGVDVNKDKRFYL